MRHGHTAMTQKIVLLCSLFQYSGREYMREKVVVTHSESETILAGEQFAAGLVKGDVVACTGELGAGKTEFIKGVCQYFQVEDLVTSPTFSVINQYKGKCPDGRDLIIFHVDLYRIENPDELAKIGFDDMIFAHDAIKLIEWPEHAATLMPAKYWDIVISPVPDKETQRRISINRTGE